MIETSPDFVFYKIWFSKSYTVQSASYTLFEIGKTEIYDGIKSLSTWYISFKLFWSKWKQTFFFVILTKRLPYVSLLVVFPCAEPKFKNKPKKIYKFLFELAQTADIQEGKKTAQEIQSKSYIFWISAVWVFKIEYLFGGFSGSHGNTFLSE